MKRQLTVFACLAMALAAQAKVIEFELSPNGVPGLSPSNEVSAVIGSTGSGGEIGSGIKFDTDTSTLSLSLGYGSAAGFTDLTGPATAMHIHGPAMADANAGVITSLMGLSFPSVNPATGGIIFGNLVLDAGNTSNLLAGLFYINIHTATNQSGELRGQLIPLLNTAPEIVCPEPVTAECESVTTLTVQVSDADDDALTLVWTVNGVPMQTNAIIGGATSAAVPQSFEAIYQLGTNEVTFKVTDANGESAECSTTVVVVDTTPPVITNLKTDKAYLWPPNHKMIPVKLSATVTDLCGSATWKITSITSNQPDNGLGDGNTSNDWKITGDHTALLRAERSGKNGTREYTLQVTADDESGNESESVSVKVYVPHDARALSQIKMKK
jgi:hypothetical protein